MSQEQYYLRLRGKIQGPFDSEKLRMMARRGQFSRLHEVSPDGKQWSSAQEWPSLFTAPSTGAEESFQLEKATATATAENEGYQMSPLAAPAKNASQTRQDQWYYANGGTRVGPIDFQTLFTMFQNARLTHETLVWKEGMDQWTAANQVPGLTPAPLQPIAKASVMQPLRDEVLQESNASQKMGEIIIRVMEDSRPWVLFLGIMTCLYAVFVFVVGLIQITVGARSGVLPVTLAGITGVISSILFALGGCLLLSYASRISRFMRYQKETMLYDALTTLKSFWVYVSMNLIIILLILLVLFIFMIAVVGSFPSPRSIFTSLPTLNEVQTLDI